MRRASKVDSTHGEIVEAFRQAGWAVLSLATIGNGAPDLLVYGYHPRHGRGIHLIEVKRPKGKLRHAQQLFGARWPVTVLRTADEAWLWMGFDTLRPKGVANG